MNKKMLITAICEKVNSVEGMKLTKKDCAVFVDAFTDVVFENLAKGEKVSIVGFGSFEVTDRAAREGRNPQTGETMQIPASKTPKFKASKNLKDAVNA